MEHIFKVTINNSLDYRESKLFSTLELAKKFAERDAANCSSYCWMNDNTYGSDFLETYYEISKVEVHSNLDFMGDEE